MPDNSEIEWPDDPREGERGKINDIPRLYVIDYQFRLDGQSLIAYQMLAARDPQEALECLHRNCNLEGEAKETVEIIQMRILNIIDGCLVKCVPGLPKTIPDDIVTVPEEQYR